VKKHPWFAGIDWDKLLLKQIPPPFVPRTTGVGDTGNVDDEFLNELPEETPAEMNALLTIHNSDALFDNFSFVNESNIIKSTDPNTTSQTGESQGKVGLGRRNSFDDDTPLELDSLPGD
jgi:hypothetical protein